MMELYVLCCISVTAATFHLDRSPLNAEANRNAAGVNTVVDAKQKRNHKKKQRKKKEEKCVKRVILLNKTRKTRKRWNCTYLISCL